MVPGITDTECRIAQFRYRELHAEATQQRRAAQAAAVRAGRVRVMETVQRHIGALVEWAIRVRTRLRTEETTERAVA